MAHLPRNPSIYDGIFYLNMVKMTNMDIIGDPTFAPTTIAPAMKSLTTKSWRELELELEGNDWVFG